jgi:hypothetical protein
MLSLSLVNPHLEPSVVDEFSQAQRACYEEFSAEAAVSEVAQEDLLSGRVVYFVARDETGAMVGGLRLHLSFPGTKLPVEHTLSQLSQLARGQGMAMAANKQAGIRAAVVMDPFSAAMAREHNDANVLCLGARVVGTGLALDIVATWLGAEFEGGRHQRRLDKIAALEGRASTVSS